jgi:hypothetical protein
VPVNSYLYTGPAFWQGGVKYALQPGHPNGVFSADSLESESHVHFRWHVLILRGGQRVPGEACAVEAPAERPVQQCTALDPPFGAMVAHWQGLAAGGEDFRAQPLSSASVPRAVGIGCSLILMQHWLVMVVCSTKRVHLQGHALHGAFREGAVCSLSCAHGSHAKVDVLITGVGTVDTVAEAVDQWGAGALTPFVPVKSRPAGDFRGASNRTCGAPAVDVCVPAGSSGSGARADCLEAYDDPKCGVGGGSGLIHFALFAFLGTACYKGQRGIVPAADEHLHHFP